MTVLNVKAQNACIWGRAQNYKDFINGQYVYSDTINGAPWFTKLYEPVQQTTFVTLYLWKASNSLYYITHDPPTNNNSPSDYEAYCAISTNSPWECGLNWKLSDTVNMVTDPNVYSQEGSCPEWNCDAIDTTSINIFPCSIIWQIKVGPNAWSNTAGSTWFYFHPMHFRWLCVDKYIPDSFNIPLEHTHSKTKWVEITKGGSVNLDFYNYNEYNYYQHEIKCVETTTTIPTIQPTIHPTVEPSNYPTLIPSNDPTTVPTSTPTKIPTASSTNPTVIPSKYPTFSPSINPSIMPSMTPTKIPTAYTNNPTITSYPTNNPTLTPSHYPTIDPTNDLSLYPTKYPTKYPTFNSINSPSNPTLGIGQMYSPSIAPTINSTFIESMSTMSGLNEKEEGLNNIILILVIISCILLFCIAISIIIYIKLKDKKNRNIIKNITHIVENEMVSSMSDSNGMNVGKSVIDDNVTKHKLENNNNDNHDINDNDNDESNEFLYNAGIETIESAPNETTNIEMDENEGSNEILYENGIKTAQTHVDELEDMYEREKKDGFYAIAIMDYIGHDEDQLNLNENGMFFIMKTMESGWWFGINEKGNDGWIPSNYLEKCDLNQTKQQQKGQIDVGELMENSNYLVNTDKYLNMKLPPKIVTDLGSSNDNQEDDSISDKGINTNTDTTEHGAV